MQNQKPEKHENSELKAQDIKKELTMVGDADAIENPRTMADRLVSTQRRTQLNLLVVFSYAAIAALAVFAAQRRPQHTLHAKVLLVIFPFGIFMLLRLLVLHAQLLPTITPAPVCDFVSKHATKDTIELTGRV